jgi:hypothetical protein
VCFLYVFAAFLLLLLLLLLHSFCLRVVCVRLFVKTQNSKLKNHRMHVFSPEFLLAAFVIIITSRSEEEE